MTTENEIRVESLTAASDQKTVVTKELMKAIVDMTGKYTAYFNSSVNDFHVNSIEVLDEDGERCTTLFPPYSPSEFFKWIIISEYQSGINSGKIHIQYAIRSLLDIPANPDKEN